MAKRIKASSGLNLRTKSEKTVLTVVFILFAIYAFTLLFPMFWAGYNSLKTSREFNGDQFSFPKDPQWENYTRIFSDDSAMSGISIPIAIWNTIWMTVGGVCVGTLCSAMTSYVVCKYPFKGMGIIYTVAVFIMIIPIVGSLPASYRLHYEILGTANNPWLWWTTWTGGLGFDFLMLYSAWKNLSWNYAEAAFIDGASNWKVFYKIMLPMIKPVIVSLVVVGAIGGWTNYMTSYLYMTEYPSLGYAIYILQQQANYIGIPMYLAIIMISIIPTLAIFMGFQNTIMQNMTVGGLKG